MAKKNKKSMYDEMVESLATFVIRTAEKVGLQETTGGLAG